MTSEWTINPLRWLVLTVVALQGSAPSAAPPGSSSSRAVAQSEPPQPKTLTEAEQAARLKERDQLWQVAKDARKQGDIPAAIKAAQVVLAIEQERLGAEHAELIGTLEFLAACHETNADFASAQTVRADLVQRVTKAFGEADYRVVDAKLAVKHVATLAGLTPDQRKQLAEASVANGHIVQLYRAGQFANAGKFAESVLETRHALLGEDHPDTAKSLNNLADVYRAQRKYAAAEPLYVRALKIREKVLGPIHPDTATSLNNLAALYSAQGNYAAAELLSLRAIKIYQKSLDPDHSYIATSVNNLAGLFDTQGNYAAAEPLYVRVLRIREKVLGPIHPDTATSVNNLASVYESQGNYAAAEPLYVRALKIREKSLDHRLTAASLNNLAELYRKQANFAAAEPLYLQALKMAENAHGADHLDIATSLSNLALLYYSQRNYAAAEPLVVRALKITEQSPGPDHPDTATILNSLAALINAQGNYATAEPLYVRALKIFEKTLGPDHPTTAMSFSNLALFQWGRDRAAVAAPFAERALGILLRHLDATAAIQTEHQQFLASHLVDGNNSVWLTVSGVDSKLTSIVYRDVLAWKGLITSRQQGLRRTLKDDPRFSEFRQVSQQLSNITLSPPVPPSDPQEVAAWRAREPELRRIWQSKKASLVVEHERVEKELAVNSVRFRESLEDRRVLPEDLVATLKVQDRQTALVDVLEYRYYPRKNKDEKGERRIVAFVVRGDQPLVRVELGSAKAVSEQIALWRGKREQSDGTVTQENPGSGPEAVAAGDWLREHVWKPLEKHLEGIETVLISPDGALAQLPWGALPGEKPGTFLLEEHSIALIPVPQMLPSLLRKERRLRLPESLLLAGDIAYGGDPGQPRDLFPNRSAVGRTRDGRLMEFAKLNAAQGEMASIKEHYQRALVKVKQQGTVKSLWEAEATEAAFREHASHHHWLHVITHGFFAPEIVRSAGRLTGVEIDKLQQTDHPRSVQGEHPGLLSGLAFAGANLPPDPEKDDGILTALEVAALDLSQVDAVVLSACETGLGSVAGGEGLLGLQRAFQVAGARTVVASLWKVSDAATASLMQRFYENVWEKNLPKLEALREAQIWMLHDKHAGFQDTRKRGLVDVDQESAQDQPLPPYYWSAFVLSGDWR